MELPKMDRSYLHTVTEPDPEKAEKDLQDFLKKMETEINEIETGEIGFEPDSDSYESESDTEIDILTSQWFKTFTETKKIDIMHLDITTNNLNNVIKLFLTDLKVVVDNLEKMLDKNSKTN